MKNMPAKKRHLRETRGELYDDFFNESYSIFRSFVTRSRIAESAVVRQGKGDKVTDGLELELEESAVRDQTYDAGNIESER